MQEILQSLQIILLKQTNKTLNKQQQNTNKNIINNKTTTKVKAYQLEAEKCQNIQFECYESLGKEQNRNHSHLTAQIKGRFIFTNYNKNFPASKADTAEQKYCREKTQDVHNNGRAYM